MDPSFWRALRAEFDCGHDPRCCGMTPAHGPDISRCAATRMGAAGTLKSQLLTVGCTSYITVTLPHSNMEKTQREAVRSNFDYAAFVFAIRTRLADVAWIYNHPSSARPANRFATGQLSLRPGP